MNEVTTQEEKTKVLSAVLIRGDLANLSEEEKLGHLKSVCESLGLNPLTNPFKYIQMNGKLVLYAGRDATDQLRKIHNVSLEIVSREKVDDCFIVTARAKSPSGRIDESVGAVYLGTLKGEGLANAYMKAETKAKRRVTLSICGLGLLDETEVETIPRAERAEISAPREIPAQSKEAASAVFKRLREELYQLADKHHWSNEAMKSLIKQRYQKESTLDLLIGELEDFIEFIKLSVQFVR